MKPNQIAEANGEIENELLLWVLRVGGNDEASHRIRSILQRELDWDYLLVLADEHRITPVLHDRFESFSQNLPEGFWAELRKRRRQIAESNFGLASKLLKLLAVLQSHSIPAIAYKGPALAQSAYGDIGRRQFIDLDIMVRKQDLPKVKEVLLANGCEPAWKLTAAQEAAVLRHYYEYPFLCNDRKVLVEVHWDFAESFFSFSFNLDQIWDRLESVMILGEPVRTLSPEDSLLVLCAHGSKHAWARLGWVCDIAQLISRRQDLNWELAVARAKALGVLRILCVGLRLATELTGLEPPEVAAQKVRSQPQLAFVTEQLRQGIFASDKRAGALRMDRLQLKMRERFKDKFRYCYRLILMTKLIDSLFMPMGRPR